VAKGDGFSLELREAAFRPGQYGTGDYYVKIIGSETRHRIAGNTDRTLSLSPDHPLDMIPPPGTAVEIQVRLQRPQVDPEKCIGCGVCEHECPVTGRRAIRVTAENESRSRKRSMIL
jgi:NAD-dependent dihydropyrimidine dehydrogenase PreA subunit